MPAVHFRNGWRCSRRGEMSRPCWISPRLSISGCATRARRCALVGADAGKPAALEQPAGARRVARQTGGAGRAASARRSRPRRCISFRTCSDARTRPGAVFMDAGMYPIARWGAERAAARGAAVVTFPAARCRRRTEADRGDGTAAAAGRRRRRILPNLQRSSAHSANMLQCVEQRRLARARRHAGAGHPGRAAGGERPTARAAADRCARTASRRRMIVGSSLAKAFGVANGPLSGAAGVVRRFVRE